MALRTLVPEDARLLVLAPHPDDETLMAGGLLAALPSGRALVVSATDGEASHSGGAAFRRCLAEQRRRELMEALALLGHSSAAVRRLALPDGRLADFEDDLVNALRRLALRSDVLLTTAPFDGHPDHEACARAAERVRASLGCALWYAPVWAWHWQGPDAMLPFERFRKVRLTRTQRAAKAHAVARFRSQLDDGTGPPIVPPEVLAHFARPFETVVAA
jgi:LmbE family N-acetylglucosaminyl deacetylase